MILRLAAIAATVLTMMTQALGQPGRMDFVVNGVRHNAKSASVVAQLGKPRRIENRREPAKSSCTGAAQTFRTLNYDGLQASLMGDGRARNLRVYAILITSDKWSASGVKLDMDIKSVRDKLGPPRESFDNDETTTTMYYETRDQFAEVSFEFRQGRLVRILMAEAIC